jgi:hypothetical protein
MLLQLQIRFFKGLIEQKLEMNNERNPDINLC